MPIAIIGAGVSGCTLACCLAEAGYIVHVYEAADRFGGTAYTGRYPCTLSSEKVKNFLVTKVRFWQDKPGVYRPFVSWEHFCQQLLDHRAISSLHTAKVCDLQILARYYKTIFSTASPDTLLQGCYGDLSYVNGVPARATEDLERYRLYRNLLDSVHVHALGMYGRYRYLTIEESIEMALQVGLEYIHTAKRSANFHSQRTELDE